MGDRSSFAGELLMSFTVDLDPVPSPFSVLPIKEVDFRGGEISTIPVPGNCFFESCSLLVLPGLTVNSDPSSFSPPVLLLRRWTRRGGATNPGPILLSSRRPALVL